MEFRRNKILLTTTYIICFMLYLIASIICYNCIFLLNHYYLFVTIPLSILFITLTIHNFIKMILITASLIYGKNGNSDTSDKIEDMVASTNQTCKYILIAIFVTLLSSIVILDTAFCIFKEKYTFLGISIVVWIILYYILFKNIIEMIRKEIKYKKTS